MSAAPPIPVAPYRFRPRLSLIALVFGLLVIGPLVWPYVRPAPIVAIPDPVLKAALHDLLRVPATEPIHVRHLERLTYLDLSSRTRIADLTGLEAATQLRTLVIRLRPGTEPALSQVEALRATGLTVRLTMLEESGD